MSSKDRGNLLAHEYLGIDAEEVWQIVNNDLPRLKADPENLPEALPDP